MSVRLRSWESQNLLFQHLMCMASSLVIGGDIESPQAFYSCSVERKGEMIEIGIIVNQPGPPSVCHLQSSERVFIGHDQSLTIVDVGSCKVLEDILLEGMFFEFLTDDVFRQILVIHELGIVAVSSSGSIQWGYSTPDILEGWQLMNDRISLTVIDRLKPIILDLSSGIDVANDDL